jgi:L-iditol 2-dehydrogenase
VGLGSIGLIMGQVAASENVTVTGLDLLSSRLELAKELGFDNVIASYDYIFLTAGSAPTIDLALQAARNGATIVVFSSVKGEANFDNNDIYYRELTITSSYSPNLEDLRESLDLLARGKVQVDKLITHRSNLENLGTTIEQAKQEQGIKVYLAP